MRIRTLMQDEKGATAVEYGLILSFVVLVMLVGLREFASASISQWNYVADEVQNAG